MTTVSEIAAFKPRNIDEALDTMRTAIDFFHQQNDHRVVFLRAYYLITIAVHQAAYGRGRYPKRIFFDKEWIKKLAGKFSLLYFQSLNTDGRPGERAWKIAHDVAKKNEGSVLQDLMLGLNAHINYDLAYGISLNMREFNDGGNHLLLPRRKFDHDQVNNILIDSMPAIQETLTRDYGGEIRMLGEAMWTLDDVIAGAGLKYYRERVWWNAIAHLTAESEEETQLVHDRLDWESAQIAKGLTFDGSRVQRLAAPLFRLMRKKTFGRIELEREPAGPTVVSPVPKRTGTD